MLVSVIHGPLFALPPNSQGGRPVGELRRPGSVRGALSNCCSYRDAGMVNSKLCQNLEITTQSVQRITAGSSYILI